MNNRLLYIGDTYETHKIYMKAISLEKLNNL